MLQAAIPALVLASASPTRRRLLASAGLTFEAIATGVDEDRVKREARLLGGTPEATALRLARLKAQAIDRLDDVILGCDQILVCDGICYDKPASLVAARIQLRALRGRPHRLATATVALRDGAEIWRHEAAPRLMMRQFTEPFLDRYLATEGESLLGCVGAYRLEGLGVHLFDSVEGDHATILGLPVIPLLGFLRHLGILPT